MKLAISYSPRRPPSKYHQRTRAWLPGSVCFRVYPRSYGHQLHSLVTLYNMQSPALRSTFRPPEDFPVPYTTQKPSIISTGLLNTLLYFHLRPIQQVVSLRSYTFQSRELISKLVSHLDAFSGYLFRTWLLSGAPGGTTDTPEVRPPRSSRTRGSPSQFSFAHSG